MLHYFLTVKVAPPPFNVTANFMSRFFWECEARIKEKVAWDFLVEKYPTVVLRSIYSITVSDISSLYANYKKHFSRTIVSPFFYEKGIEK
jgi:hypothetical protein